MVRERLLVSVLCKHQSGALSILKTVYRRLSRTRPTFPQVYIDGEFFGGCDITVGAKRQPLLCARAAAPV